MLADDFDPPPEAPEPPADDACCDSGCEPCIWDTYNAQLMAYRAQLAAWQQREAVRLAAKDKY
ncbi:oxidoreductase-like domain-containing protein [Neisseriaceae bacterium TC5R-5]|nr:oxidoreductase-like domain-containing protein [Neisseriaceae bacterium TC5R-5]